MNNTMNNAMIRGSVVMALVALLAVPAFAQPGGPPHGGMGGPGHGGMRDGHGHPGAKQMRKRIRARLLALRSELLRKDVGLTETRAKKAEGVLARFAKERRTLQRSAHQHTKAVHLLVRSDSNDQAAYRQAVNGMIAAREALASLHGREFAALRKILKPKEQALLLLGLHRLKRRSHRIMAKARKAHMEKKARRMLKQMNKGGR
ncbi:MAG: hypothetical protein KC502_18110 [Myxococcales bacterium]|nr:hypothetical protein [Myxococcales bacterium]